MKDQVVTLERVEAFTPRRSWTTDEAGGASGLNKNEPRMLVARPAEILLSTVSDMDSIRHVVYAHTFNDRYAGIAADQAPAVPEPELAEVTS